jgi:hypothetical protein
MSNQGDTILDDLRHVEALRQQRASDGEFDARVVAVKAYQQARFRQTYADLLAHPRYAGAARFFLDELYGPGDFAQRDAQFARIVPALVRLFPAEIVGTVANLARLHALSEDLDVKMGKHVDTLPLSAAEYVLAWQATARREDRQKQIDLTLAIGQAMEDYTRKPMLRHTLRLMRGPARAAGLSALQAFLEAGFDTFREMRGAEAFLQTVQQRELAFVTSLFATDAQAAGQGTAS